MPVTTRFTTQELTTLISATYPDDYRGASVYGIPRGGWCVAKIIEGLDLGVQTDDVLVADIIIDDLVDSGATMHKWTRRYPSKKFWTPFPEKPEHWIVFPWELSKEMDARDPICRIFQLIGENPEREGLKATPDRVVRMWKEIYSGYDANIHDIMSAQFQADCDEMVICKDIEFYSTCEHHMLPFYGKVHIGYLPNGVVIGVSKLARLVDAFARRLQIQEQMTYQIAEAIMKEISGCQGVGVVVEGIHLCMRARGVGKQNASMTTSALLGSFKTSETRSEFFSHIKK